jgi:hypothetical protein
MIVNNHRMRVTPGSSSNSTLNWAKSTCACLPAAVSKRRSKGWTRVGLTVRRKSVTTL